MAVRLELVLLLLLLLLLLVLVGLGLVPLLMGGGMLKVGEPTTPEGDVFDDDEEDDDVAVVAEM